MKGKSFLSIKKICDIEGDNKDLVILNKRIKNNMIFLQH